MKKAIVLCFVLGGLAGPAAAETVYFPSDDGAVAHSGAAALSSERGGRAATAKPVDASWSLSAPTRSLALLASIAALGFVASRWKTRKRTISVFD